MFGVDYGYMRIIISVKKHLCRPDYECFVILRRLYNLSQDIPCVKFVLVYLPNGSGALTGDIIRNSLSQIQLNKTPSAVLSQGDFNDPIFSISTFKEYATCITRNQSTIDL